MALVNNPFCVRLFYSFRSAHCMILVMEYMVGGDLATLLKQLGYFEDDMARSYLAEIVAALEYVAVVVDVHAILYCAITHPPLYTTCCC